MSPKGFALLEILVVVAILALVVGGGLYANHLQLGPSTVTTSTGMNVVPQAQQVVQQANQETQQEQNGLNQVAGSASPATTTATAATTSQTAIRPSPSVVNEYIITEPNALILVDAQGRRTGKDPMTGTLYNEIPGTTYNEEAVNPGHPVGELFTSDLPSGQYTLYVLSGQTGSYALDIALNSRQAQSVSGSIQAGTMAAYVQNYDSANLASSTFSLEGTASSTASITSTPGTLNTQVASSVVPTVPSTPSTQTNVWGEYHVNLPDALMLVDAQGRRTGEDPATGVVYSEIPGASYIVIGPGSGAGAGELFTSNLPDGHYTLYVLGGETGNYWLDATHYGQQAQHFSGPIESGSMVAYAQDYKVAGLASSTFSLAGTASSTGSITSAPPNNLPPPPVPLPPPR